MLHDPELHYLDNAATVHRVPEVRQMIDKAMREHLGQPLRAAHGSEESRTPPVPPCPHLGCKSKELYLPPAAADRPAARTSARQASNSQRHGTSGRAGCNVTAREASQAADGTHQQDADAVDKNNPCGQQRDRHRTVERLAAEVATHHVHDAVQAWSVLQADNTTRWRSAATRSTHKGVGRLTLSDRLGCSAPAAPVSRSGSAPENRRGLLYTAGSISSRVTRLFNRGASALEVEINEFGVGVVPEVLNFSENCIKSETMLGSRRSRSTSVCQFPWQRQPQPLSTGPQSAGYLIRHLGTFLVPTNNSERDASL